MSLEEIAASIRTMKIHGAGRIARSAAQAMVDHSTLLADRISDLESYRLELKNGSELLLSTRPTAVSLGNALRWIDRAIRTDVGTIQELKAAVVNVANQFCEDSLHAVETIGAIGAKRIHDGFTIQTHCNSKAAMAPIKHAHDQGKELRVQATETRPKHQGYKTSRELSEYGLNVTLIVDSAVRYFMRNVDVVFVGADTVTSDGTLINKIGTSQIALAAFEHNVPFYVCAETYKFSPSTLDGDEVIIEERDPTEIIDREELPKVNIKNPVFDFTPSKYITAIITEKGMIPPQAAYLVVQELLSG